MKTKKEYHLPDSYYNFFGIYVSGSNNPNDKVILPDTPGKFVSESDRIGTLARESRYKSYFPILKKINLLTFNYPSLPQDPVKKAEYVKRIIRNNIKKALASLSPDGKLNKDCLDYVKGFFHLCPESISIKVGSREDDVKAGMASQVLDCTEVMSITFSKLNNVTVHANPFSSRKIKHGYYHMRNNPSLKIQIIDLLAFLTDASLINALFESLADSSIPIIQNVYERCAANIMQHPEKSAEEEQILNFISSGNTVPYEFLFRNYHTQKEIMLMAGMASRLSSGLFNLFCEILEIFQDISHENNYREQITRNIATAYMTKKNIPESVLNAMEHTDFLHYFKYVEFDEDTDLESVSAIEKEFEAMNKAYFSGSIFPDVKIRFRKLGKHKASGLYYPSLNTLCVDIRSPSSFMHEYFHMIDNQLGDLSLDPGFQGIVTEYKNAFLEGLKNEEQSVREKMNGKSKYNIGYFFRRAEIFARCGEIYLARILKAQSSLLNPDLGYAYPESEVLDSLIKKYYNDLLHEKLACSVFSKAC